MLEVLESIDVREIWPGTRVMVFDHTLFKDDVSTPLSFTVRPATVVCRYGRKTKPDFMTETGWIYPDLVDVKFDHDGRISHGHFTDGVKLLKEES